MPYLNCPNCRLTMYVAPLHVAIREECPRCAARLGKASRLFRSELPHRLLGPVGVESPRPEAPR